METKPRATPRVIFCVYEDNNLLGQFDSMDDADAAARKAQQKAGADAKGRNYHVELRMSPTTHHPRK